MKRLLVGLTVLLGLVLVLLLVLPLLFRDRIAARVKTAVNESVACELEAVADLAVLLASQ